MENDSIKPYVRVMDEQSVLYEYYARQHGLQGKSLQLLLWIYNYPAMTGKFVTQKLLAERTYSTKQVVNATIKSWQKKGYVELVANSSDKRHKLVSLTAAGQVFAQAIIQPLNDIERAAIQRLNADDQAVLLDLTAKYNAALKVEMEKAYDTI